MHLENSEIIVRYCAEDPKKSDRWEVKQPIVLQTIVGEVTIPVGYITDFASTPTLLWGIFPPIGRHNLGSVLHDYWYDNRLGESEYGEEIARKLADLEYWMRLNQAEPRRRFRNKLMYLACRWFGRSWWID